MDSELPMATTICGCAGMAIVNGNWAIERGVGAAGADAAEASPVSVPSIRPARVPSAGNIGLGDGMGGPLTAGASRR